MPSIRRLNLLAAFWFALAALTIGAPAHAVEPPCFPLNSSFEEVKRQEQAFDVKKFTEAKVIYDEFFKNSGTSAEAIEKSQFPKTSEEFLAFLEAIVEMKLP